jgi:hypothetical protein
LTSSSLKGLMMASIFFMVTTIRGVDCGIATMRTDGRTNSQFYRCKASLSGNRAKFQMLFLPKRRQEGK